MFFKKFDFISPEITLYYRGDDRHSSIPSAIISLICLILIIAMAIYVSLDFLLKRPTAFYYHNYSDDLGIYYLNATNFFHFVNFEFIENHNSKTIDLKSFSIIGVQIKDATFISNNNPTKYDHYIYELCDKNDAINLYEYMDDAVLYYFNKSYCIKKFYNSSTKTIISYTNENFNYPYLIHGAKRNDYIDYGIYIQRCKNISDYNENYCNSDSLINQEFSYLTKYAILYTDFIVDINNYKNPLNVTFPRVSNSFNELSYTANHLNFNPLQIATHEGIIFDKDSVIDSYIYDYTEKLVISNSGNGIIGSFHFWLQNQVECYDRTYKKIQDISGSIDGLVEIMMFIIEIINTIIFHDYKILYDFNNEIEKAVIRIKETSNINKILSISYSYNGNQNKKNNNNSFIINSLNKKNENENSIKINNKVSKVFIYNKKFNPINISNIPTSNNNTEQDELNNITKINKRKNSLNNRSTKLEKKWKKIKWNELFCRFRQTCLMSKYVNFIQQKREDIISEEMIIKYYLAIKKIKDYLISNFEMNSKKNNNYSFKNISNNNANIEILKEEDDIESINISDFEQNHKIQKKRRKNIKSNNFNL